MFLQEKLFALKEMSHEQRKEYIEKHPEYGRIICRCETISEEKLLMRFVAVQNQ